MSFIMRPVRFASTGDANFNRVSFLSHFDGSNNDTSSAFVDSSSTGHTVSNTDFPIQSSYSPHSKADGYWSWDTQEDGYFIPAASSDFTMGTGDFTVECFVFYYGAATGGIFQMSDGPLPDSHNGIGMGVASGGKWSAYIANTLREHGSLYPVYRTWQHIALVRASSTTKMYVDGVEILSFSDSTNYTGDDFTLGVWYDASFTNDTAIISNFRLVKGTAVYTSDNFTPPSNKLTAITNTKFLACQSNTFKDNSTSNHVIAVVDGNAANTNTNSHRGSLKSPKVTPFSPFASSDAYDPAVHGASFVTRAEAEVDQGDIRIANSSDFDIGTDSFCVEFWINQNKNQNFGVIGGRATAGQGQLLFETHADKVKIWASTDGNTDNFDIANGVTISGDVFPGSWHHIALIRAGSVMNSYHNGVRVLNDTSGNYDFFDSNAAYVIGRYIPLPQAVYKWDGYISDYRVVIGSTAGYDVSASTITVPTAPLTNITNTKLLLNMANGKAVDTARTSAIQFFNQAKLSTTQKKFGDTSLYLDGAGDLDFVKLNDIRNLANDFTIECWAWAANTGQAYIWSLGITASAWLALGISGSNVRFDAAGEVSLTTGGEFTATTWHHIALVRSGSTITGYLNGTAMGTTVSSSTDYPVFSGSFYIGGQRNSSSSVQHGWEGYIDDFRISEFARYTEDFDVPEEPFSDK